jgi:hypothetical protein
LAVIPLHGWPPFRGFASAEIIVRRAPLAAYMHRARYLGSPQGKTGYILRPNVVYQEGTEKTARAMFAYRIGMTMAKRACRGLMGLGPTIHAEDVPLLPGRGHAWSQKTGQPDLVGFRERSPQTWFVEAKAARRLGKTELSKGISQLSVDDLMAGPHLRVLCGTSIEHRVFMTIDIEVVSGTGTSSPGDSAGGGPDEDDAELIALARSRMPSFYALSSLPAASLSVRPVGPAVADTRSRRQRTASLVEPQDQPAETRS